MHTLHTYGLSICRQYNTQYVAGFEKTWLPHTIINIRNADFNYLKYYNSGRETDACMKFAIIL